MSRALRVSLFCACVILGGALPSAGAVSVFPNPVQFGTVSENTTGFPVYVDLTDTTASAVTITNMAITGANSADFTFGPWTCVGVISGNQTCQMYMTFTPNAVGNISATLAITVSGVANPINIPLVGSGGNPVPNVTSISPPGVYVNTPTTKVTINGTGFLSSSLVYLQNAPNPLPTTFVSATQITAQVPDTALANTGQVSLWVANPQPGGGTGSFSLQVVSEEPSISSVTPASVIAGTPSEPLLVNGQNFLATSKVQWNGTNIPTTYISSTQLQAQPPAADFANAGIVQLAVNNPAPGTLSPPTIFNVTYPVTVNVLNLPANALVWDPFAQVIYASLPSTDGPNGNSIAVINPATGAVTGYFFAGSEPNKIALDSNSKFLYVGLNGNGSIQRLNLPAFTPDIQINLGAIQGSGPNTAAALAVSPTNAHLLAVALGQGNCCGGGPLEFFSDASKLANSVSSSAMNQLAFASGTTLYGYESNTLSQVTVSATGGTLAQQWSGLVDGNTIQYSGGLIFGGSGEEFNPTTGLLLGTFDVGNVCCGPTPQVFPDFNINRAFALGQTPFFNGLGITSYNLTQFTPLAVANLSGLIPAFNSSTPSNLIQWGSNGLAFILTNGCCGTTTSQVVLIQSPGLFLTATKNVNPVPVPSAPTPGTVTHGAANFRLTLKGTGFVPGSTVTWNGKTWPSSYVNSKQLTVYVPKAAVAKPGTAAIQVKNPTPGGGKSNPVTLTIE